MFLRGFQRSFFVTLSARESGQKSYAMTRFDARAAKLLTRGGYLGLDDYPGLRLQASARFRSWIYRYRSPVDGLIRQVRIGRWPEMSVSAAIVAWEGQKRRRDAGEDIAADKSGVPRVRRPAPRRPSWPRRPRCRPIQCSAVRGLPGRIHRPQPGHEGTN